MFYLAVEVGVVPCSRNPCDEPQPSLWRPRNLVVQVAAGHHVLHLSGIGKEIGEGGGWGCAHSLSWYEEERRVVNRTCIRQGLSSKHTIEAVWVRQDIASRNLTTDFACLNG